MTAFFPFTFSVLPIRSRYNDNLNCPAARGSCCCVSTVAALQTLDNIELIHILPYKMRYDCLTWSRWYYH
jgi:hypothetical protein